jgi:hypothetical protein
MAGGDRMSADRLLEKLDGVRATAPGRWIAKCPAHEDRRASLSIREADDDKTLVHCFAGCAVDDVVAAAGLELADLFPPRTDVHSVKGERRPFPAADVLRCIAFEALVVAIAASRLGAGNLIDAKDRARLLLAASRIQAAVKESGHA